MQFALSDTLNKLARLNQGERKMERDWKEQKVIRTQYDSMDFAITTWYTK